MKRREFFGSVAALSFALQAPLGVAAETRDSPDVRAQAEAIAPEVTPQQRADIVQRLQAKRDAAAEAASEVQSELSDSPSNPPPVSSTPTDPRLPTGVSTEADFTLTVGRNAKNTVAEGAANSTLAEPAAMNNRGVVLYAGNFSHLERSTNHGVSYTAQTVPAGPTDAPIPCCDWDMASDTATGQGIASYLYVNSALNNGVVRFFVRNPDMTAKCQYTFDIAGTANNILPDYPHISINATHVYLSFNGQRTNGTSFASMLRWPKSQILGCLTATRQTFNQEGSVFGQRVWVPAGGAHAFSNMMWVQHDNATTMRIFNWTSAATAPTSVTRAVASSVFANPDCRGGTGNFDFIERSTATSIAGFRTRCAMAFGVDNATPVLDCLNHSAPNGAARPHAYLRGTTFRTSDRVLISQRDIFSTGACWGYPAMSSNSRGNIGMSAAFGGRTGGSGIAVQGTVLMKTPGSVIEARIVASGVANRSDGRFGDYFTAGRYQGCQAWFRATSYAWDSSPVDAANDVNARWVEFGRFADQACWTAAQ